MELGVQLYSLRNYIQENGLESALEIISNAGFTGVEFAGFYGLSEEEMKDLLAKYRLKAISAHIRPEMIEGELLLLKSLGIKCSIIPYIDFNKTISFEDGLQQCLKAKELLNANGIALGYHNHSHEFLNGGDVLARLCKKIPDIKLELDCFWLKAVGIDPVEYMNARRDNLLYLHIKEYGESADGINPVIGSGNSHSGEVIKEGENFGLEWSILECERIDVKEEEYLKRSFDFMSKFI